MAEEKKPTTPDEIRIAMKVMEDRVDSLSSDEIDQYESLEKELLHFSRKDKVRQSGQRWEAPRVNLQPASVIKGSRDDGRYTYDQFLRGDETAAREIEAYASDERGKPANNLRGGPPRLVRWPLSDSAKELESFAQTETTTAGGYTVPTVTAPIMVKIQKAFGGIANRAFHLNTNNGAPLNFPSIDDTANSSVIAAINTAAGSAGADLVFGQVSLSAFKYTATGTGNLGLKVPRELIDDALFDISGLVNEMLGVRLARKMAADYAQGIGTTAPNGLFHYIGDVVALNGGLVAATAVTQLQTIIHTLDPAYVNESCAWYMNWATHGVIAGFIDSTYRPLMQPSYQAGLSEAPGSTLLGYPVVIDQGSPAFSLTASAKPPAVNESYLAFGDINEAFVIRDVQGIGVAVDPYTGIGSNQVLYYGYARTDSVVKNRSAYVLAAGYHA